MRSSRFLRALAALSVLVSSAPPAFAQVGSDYSFGQTTANVGGTTGSGAGNFGDSQGSMASGSRVSGAAQVVVPAPFNPLAIPSESAHAPETPVERPAQNPGPLYARPGASPGQFELFSRPAPAPGEFETFVKQTLGRPLPRFGAGLLLNGAQGFTTPPTTTVPPDYRLNPGDELLIGVTGSVEADLRVVIDNEGRIFVPKVGAISVAGVRYGDLTSALTRRFEQQFKAVKVSVVISHLHGLTVYVTGYAVTPGAYTVSSLSTMVDAILAAGGPASGGSFRTIELRRNGRLVSQLDLYDLLLNGDKSHDVVLENEDVLNIAPAGPELAVTGSVNSEAIFEAKAGETLGDMIRFAGGPNSLADETRVLVARLADLDATGSQQLTYEQARNFPAERGDIVRILSLADIARPQERQAILATIEGEVDHPGRYYLRPGATIADLLAASGGVTGGAFLFGTALERESVRRQQQASFDRAVDELQLAAAAAPLSALGSSASSGSARQAAVTSVIERLKARKPDGRMVLNIAYEATTLPVALPIENLDHIYIPPRPKTVGVFGAVYQPGSFLFTSGGRLGDYLRLAGGPRKGVADRGQIFVVRANGAVLSSQQTHDFARQSALPGDVVFVPVHTGPSAFEKLAAIVSVLYQFSLGAAALAVLAHQL